MFGLYVVTEDNGFDVLWFACKVYGAIGIGMWAMMYLRGHAQDTIKGNASMSHFAVFLVACVFWPLTAYYWVQIEYELYQERKNEGV